MQAGRRASSQDRLPIPLVAAAPSKISNTCRPGPPNGSATSSVRRRPPKRRSPPQSTANGPVRALRQQVGEQPLGEPARVEPASPGRAAHERAPSDARSSEKSRTLRPRPGGGAGRGDRERDVQRHRRAEVGRVARGLDLGHQRAVDQAAGRGRRVVDRAQQPRHLGADRDDLARVAVQARELGVGEEAREAPVPGLELPARAGLVAAPDAAAPAEAVEPHVAGRHAPTYSNAAVRHTTIAAATRNHAALASLPAMTACTIPNTHASAVQRCSLRHRATPIRERK